MANERCIHLDVPEGRRVRSDDAFRCKCPIPAAPIYPASITMAYGYREVAHHQKTMVTKSMCGQCPCFEAVNRGK